MSPSWPCSGKLRNNSNIKKIPSRYSPTQVLQWLTCIGFPDTYSEIDISSGGFPITLENLHILTRLSTVAFPIENTALHYGMDHIMDISADSIFQRLVVERKGSYCFGLNGLFLDMLRGLGYRAYSGSGKINDPSAPARNSQVLFPMDDCSDTYFVDVGCGGNGLSRPILLSCDPHNVVMGHRLTRGSRPQSSLDSSPEGTEWRLEVLQEKGPDSKWRIVYSFLEDEFFETDYTAMNFGVSNSPGGFFVDNLVYGRNFWLTVDEARELGANDSDKNSFLTRYMGRIGMRGGIFTRHIGSGSEVIRTATTELEQRDILRELCGIDIPIEDLENATGRSAALPLGY
ncbi:arylamine N-acetyltransferase 1 [Armillaria mellea]|nr:arylamine N-acetyltransferase 1 [Armillaria mellea]